MPVALPTDVGKSGHFQGKVTPRLRFEELVAEVQGKGRGVARRKGEGHRSLNLQKAGPGSS